MGRRCISSDCLWEIGQLDLLKQLPKDIMVPNEVANEIKVGPENDAARLAIEAGVFRLVETQGPTQLLMLDRFPKY